MTTLAQVLARRGIRYHVSSRSGELMICCLFCPERGYTPDTHFRLGVNQSNGKGHCFNCEWRSRRAVRAILYRLDEDPELVVAGMADESPIAGLPIELPRDFTRLTAESDPEVWRYALGRGITSIQVGRCGMGVSYVGRYAYRLVVPVRDGKRLAGLVCRDFTGRQRAKYLNSLGAKALFNARPAARFVLSEGVFKALRIEQVVSGDWCSAAVLGRSITQDQVDQLARLGCERVSIWPDPDAPGRRGAVEIASRLADTGFRVSIVWPVDSPADEMPLDQMRVCWGNRRLYGHGTKSLVLSGVNMYNIKAYATGKD